VADVTVDAMVKRGELPAPRKIGHFPQSPVVFDETELERAIKILMADSLHRHGSDR
jgi:hypothetical protein